MFRWFSSGPRPILLCPGPVHLSRRVRQAVVRADLGHREPEFMQILDEMGRLMKPIVGLDSSDPAYAVAFITGSGTAANETVLSSLTTLGRTLVVSNGEFGERLYEVAKVHSRQVDHLAFHWQQPVSLDQVEEALASRPYQLVAMVHHETSTGMLNPVASVAKLARKYGALIAVDAISSIGAEDIKVKEWGIDALTGTSGKALSAMPGVGILVVKQALLDRLSATTRRVHYLDLHKHFRYLNEAGQTPNTPAVHVFVSLHASLREIARLGLDRFRRRIALRADYVRYTLPRLGLEHARYGRQTSSVITCVTLPPYLTFERLSTHLKRKGIVIYNGKGPLKDKIFQIGHIGALRGRDTRLVLREIKRLLEPVQLHQSPAAESAVATEGPTHGVA